MTMAQPTAGSISKADMRVVTEELGEILNTLDKTQAEKRLFRSGIELIKLTVNVGSRVEFSIVIAGKDAPKVEQLPLDTRAVSSKAV
jgi:hypothetical protein